MSSLKETKARIDLVRNTLKITSSMKMVAAAKLHKAQLALARALPYEKSLHRILEDLLSAAGTKKREVGLEAYSLMEKREVRSVAVVAFSSNSSLCGGFNQAAFRRLREVIGEYAAVSPQAPSLTVFAVGKKMVEALSKVEQSVLCAAGESFVKDCPRAGRLVVEDWSGLSGSFSFGDLRALSGPLLEGFVSGRFDRVELVFSHFKSVVSQPVVRQVLLPLSAEVVLCGPRASKVPVSSKEEMPRPANPEDFIVEPDPEALVERLLPKIAELHLFTTLLDSNAAEHGARSYAMQNATDNGNELLDSLTLEYNKTRQQKITTEILDLSSGGLVR